MNTVIFFKNKQGWKALRRALLGVTWASLMSLFLGASLSQAQDDPPGRVGRLNYVQGSVSFSPAGSDEWVEARTTRPITSGDRIWMGRNARSELSIGAAVLRADQESSVKVLQLDDDQAQFELSEGTLALQVRGMDPNDRLEISTPNLAFVIEQPGDYRIQVDPDRNTTEIIVRRGQGSAYADDGRHRLEDPGYARFDGNGLDRESDNLPRLDDFDRWVDGRIDRAANRESARYLSRDMVGYEDLDDYGDWRSEPEYGRIWVPRTMSSDWAPYRYGHWAWIAPWGWTWVDDAPWGFAPFHYGRWAYLRGHWAWVPGPVVRRPYYAPALVVFVGNPGGWSLNISSGAPAVTWFPLGPWETYRPVYRSSPTYITQINRTVVFTREGDRPRRTNDYQNRFVPGAATAQPARAFVEGRPVHRDMIRVRERDLAQAPIAGTMPTLAPVRQSLLGQQNRRLAPPPGLESARQVISTRALPKPPADRDELAQRFTREGPQVRDAGPSLVTAPRRPEARDEPSPRIIGEPRQDREIRAPRAIERQERKMESPPESPRPGQRERTLREDRSSGDPDGGRPTLPERMNRQATPEPSRPALETPRASPQFQRDGEPREASPVRSRTPEPEATGRIPRGERVDAPRRPDPQAEIQRPEPAPRFERPEDNRRPDGDRMAPRDMPPPRSRDPEPDANARVQRPERQERIDPPRRPDPQPEMPRPQAQPREDRLSPQQPVAVPASQEQKKNEGRGNRRENRDQADAFQRPPGASGDR